MYSNQYSIYSMAGLGGNLSIKFISYTMLDLNLKIASF